MDQNQSAKRTPLVHTIYDFVELFIIALCIVFITFSFAVRFCRVSGPSMENTLYNGEMLLISDLFYTPTAGDVIEEVCRFGEPLYGILREVRILAELFECFI